MVVNFFPVNIFNLLALSIWWTSSTTFSGLIIFKKRNVLTIPWCEFYTYLARPDEWCGKSKVASFHFTLVPLCNLMLKVKSYLVYFFRTFQIVGASLWGKGGRASVSHQTWWPGGLTHSHTLMHEYWVNYQPYLPLYLSPLSKLLPVPLPCESEGRAGLE